jgi:hypothetical protein
MTKIAKAVAVSGTFSGTGNSNSFLPFPGTFSVWMQGGTGTVKIERSTDLGSTWIDVSADSLGTLASYSLSSNEISVLVEEPEQGAFYRLNCTAYTSGTITYRLGQ